jgi:hypothetical protein
MPAEAQNGDHPTVILSSYYDFRFAFKNASTDGYGFAAEYVLGPDWGVAVEYSVFRVTGPPQFSTSPSNSRAIVRSPALLVYLHPSLEKRLAILAAIGIGSMNYTLNDQPFSLEPITKDRPIVMIQAKLGFRLKLVDSVHIFANASIHHLASAGLMVAI